MEANPDRKPGAEPRKRLAVNTNNFLATSLAKSSPNVMPYIPLDLVGRPFSLGSVRPPYIITQAHALVKSFPSQF